MYGQYYRTGCSAVLPGGTARGAALPYSRLRTTPQHLIKQRRTTENHGVRAEKARRAARETKEEDRAKEGKKGDIEEDREHDGRSHLNH